MSDYQLSTSITARNPILGDLFLDTNGNLVLTQTLAQVVQQDLTICLRMFQGEWFLDPSQGIPYFQSILGVKAAPGIVAQIFRTAIAQRPGIQSINSLTVTNLPNRSIQITFSITLQDGSVLTSADFLPFIVGG